MASEDTKNNMLDTEVGVLWDISLPSQLWGHRGMASVKNGFDTS